ncbi:hypothetical protein FB45DRAFT_868139 [Roridomyces roridus]|uniref:Uncharacterized protein n=1 Tax=Roridomyces roridus TaxID=1738132 RepID=A0AAD7BQ12_9AGAR|nr:hypothetical protein FB45DRAFT_868139 [Roridomyces roridus]
MTDLERRRFTGYAYGLLGREHYGDLEIWILGCGVWTLDIGITRHVVSYYAFQWDHERVSVKPELQAPVDVAKGQTRRGANKPVGKVPVHAENGILWWRIRRTARICWGYTVTHRKQIKESERFWICIAAMNPGSILAKSSQYKTDVEPRDTVRTLVRVQFGGSEVHGMMGKSAEKPETGVDRRSGSEGSDVVVISSRDKEDPGRILVFELVVGNMGIVLDLQPMGVRLEGIQSREKSDTTSLKSVESWINVGVTDRQLGLIGPFPAKVGVQFFPMTSLSPSNFWGVLAPFGLLLVNCSYTLDMDLTSAGLHVINISADGESDAERVRRHTVPLQSAAHLLLPTTIPPASSSHHHTLSGPTGDNVVF